MISLVEGNREEPQTIVVRFDVKWYLYPAESDTEQITTSLPEALKIEHIIRHLPL